MEISSQLYGLNSRVKLRQIENNHIGIVKNVKSRIIKKDAEKIIETATAIWLKQPTCKISLVCNNNICSKSVMLLNNNNIDILYL